MFIPHGNGPTFIYRTCSIARAALVILLCTPGAAAQTIYDSRKSERSDKLTRAHRARRVRSRRAGHSHYAECAFVPLNALENGKEVKSYFGVGMTHYPI